MLLIMEHSLHPLDLDTLHRSPIRTSLGRTPLFLQSELHGITSLARTPRDGDVCVPAK